MTTQENQPEPSNRLGIDGIEFVEYATAEPQAPCIVLKTMGCVQVGRYRSREVPLCRMGAVNIAVNADPGF